ncbi:hypothetical protein TWF718_003487 [Orbilia javanica]|uniref:Uncharacterized protein n=1 Tax=Orbilia javanica TaxID=47235 RepID=A0AAN8R930_9PEZI
MVLNQQVFHITFKMSSRRDNTSGREGLPPRNEQKSGTVSSWFTRTFLPSSLSSSPSSPAAGAVSSSSPRLHPRESHTTRQRQQALERSLRGEISLPTPLPQARQSPSNRSNRNLNISTPTSPVGNPADEAFYSTEMFVAPRQAPVPPFESMASTPPKRSRLPTFGGRPVQGSGSLPSSPPSGMGRPVQQVSPSRGDRVPPAAEVQVPPPTRGLRVPNGLRETGPMRNSATSPAVVRSGGVIPSVQQAGGSHSSFPKMMDSGASDVGSKSKIPTKISNAAAAASTPLCKTQVMPENAPVSPVGEKVVSRIAQKEEVIYSSTNPGISPAAAAPREVYKLPQKQKEQRRPSNTNAAELTSFEPTSVPESSSTFVKKDSSVRELPMASSSPSPEISKLAGGTDNDRRTVITPNTHTPQHDASSKFQVPNKPLPHSIDGLRKPSPNISTRSTTPSRNGGSGGSSSNYGSGGGEKRDIDFAAETPEQRGARHAANQAVYDRMNPVLRQARSGFDILRDWVAGNGGEDYVDVDVVQNGGNDVKQIPESVIPTVEEKTPVRIIPAITILKSHNESHHEAPQDTASESDTKHPTPAHEAAKVTEIDTPKVSTPSIKTSKSDISIAKPDVAATNTTNIIRRLRKKTRYHNLRAPADEGITTMLQVTDEDFLEEIPGGVLEGFKVTVGGGGAFVGLGEGCLSDEEEMGVEDEMVLEGGGSSKASVVADEYDVSSVHGDFLDEVHADVGKPNYRASTTEEKEVTIDSSLSLAQTSTQQLQSLGQEQKQAEEEEEEKQETPKEAATEQHDQVQTAAPSVPAFDINNTDTSLLHPLIAAAYPWNPHFPGAEEEFGGPVVVVPPPTTADGYLNVQAYWSDGRPLPMVRHGEIDVENCYRVVEKEKEVEKVGGVERGPEKEREVEKERGREKEGKGKGVERKAEPKHPERGKRSGSFLSKLISLGKSTSTSRPRPLSFSRPSSLCSSSSTSSRPAGHVRRYSVAMRTRRTKAMRRLKMVPTVLRTITEEEEGEGGNGRGEGASARSGPTSGIIECKGTMSQWLLSTAILDDRGGIWIPPVVREREFEALEVWERMKRRGRKGLGLGGWFGVGSGEMEWGKEEEEEMERHLLPLRCKRLAAGEVERERRALLKRWADSDVGILEIPKEVLGRLWDEEKGGLRSVTELSVEEVDLIVRETRRSADGEAMRRVKMEATTVGSSRWLRMSPFAKRRFVKFNLTDLKDRMELAAAVRGGEEGGRGYKGRRSSETFVVFEARRRRENHENAPPVLGRAVGRPRRKKPSVWARCGEAVQGFFRAAVALSSQPKPKKGTEGGKRGKGEERGYDVVRAGRGLHKVPRAGGPTQVDEASDLGEQKVHRRKRSVVRGLLSPILPGVGGEGKVARRD